MKLLDAAYQVLRSAGRPLHVNEIVRRISSSGVPIDYSNEMEPQNVTDELEAELTKGVEQGEDIVRTAKNVFTLRSMLTREIGVPFAPSIGSTSLSSIAAAVARVNAGTALTAREAAYEVLKMARRPLGIKELTKTMLETGVWNSNAKRTEASITSQLIADIRENGGESTFVKVGDSGYALRYYSLHSGDPDATPESEVDDVNALDSRSEDVTGVKSDKSFAVKGLLRAAGTRSSSLHRVAQIPRAGRLEEMTNRILLEKVKSMEDRQFEEFTVKLLREMGLIRIGVLKRARSGEIDIQAILPFAGALELDFAIQALRWRQNVRARDVQLLRGGMRRNDHGLMITTSDFDRTARDEAARRDTANIGLINGQRLVSLSADLGTDI